jgi:hypothetical protein
VFLTCYSGYGIDRRNPGNQNDLKRHLICLERANGSVLWERTVNAVLPEDEFAGAGVPEHGYASHTPVSDGANVYAFFGKSGVYAYDLDGNELWNQSVGTDSDDRRWGSASSPILVGELLIVPAIAESSSIVALDKRNGKEVWTQKAFGLNGSWSTPIVVRVDDDRSDLVIGVSGEVWGLNPANGKLRWFCGNIPGDAFYSSLVEHGGMLFGAIGSRGSGGAFAIKSGGKGDVTDTHLTWTAREQNSYSSPLIFDGKMLFVSNGIATALDVKNGNKLQQLRVNESGLPGNESGGTRQGGGRGGRDYSSPVIAADHCYYVKQNGSVFVYSIRPELKLVAVNRLNVESEAFSATPAIADGQIFIRSDKQLYCIEESKAD